MTINDNKLIRYLAIIWRLTARNPDRDKVRGRILARNFTNPQGQLAPYSQIKTYFRVYLCHIDLEEVRQATGAHLIQHNRKILGA